MDPKPLSLLVTAFANFALAMYVLLKNPKKRTNISFGLFVFSVVLWSLAVFITHIGREHEMLMFAAHMTFVGGAMMAANFLMFAYVFPETADKPLPKRLLLGIYVPGGIAAVAALTPYVMSNIAYAGTRVKPVFGRGIVVFTLYCIVFTGYGLFLLGRKYLRNPGRFERVQLKYTFWGLLAPISGVVFITLILPQMGITRFSNMTPLLTVIGVGSISYAIVRHRLMDFGVVFRNVLIYSCTTAVMTAFLIVLMLLSQILLNLPARSITFLGAVCATLLVQPTHRYMESLVDKYYFRGRYNYQVALTEFSSSMTRILDLEDLQNRIVHEVASILQVKSASLLLLDAGGQRYNVISSLPPALSDSSEGLGTDSIVVKEMNDIRGPLVKEELKRILPLSEFERIKKEFERIETEAFIPLIYRGELIGLLSLGEKISADVFSREDLNLLGTLGNQAAVALENALLHHTVTMLKNHNDNILKYMSSGVISINQGRIIDTCNHKAQEILRLQAGVALNQRIDVLPQPLRRMLLDTLTGKSRFSNQEVQILADGGKISYLSASTSLIRDEKDAVTGALLVFNDLTEIRLLEGEMRRADKLASLGTLAAGMAHEIKNPLVSIKTFAQLLPAKFEDKEFREMFSAITVDEVERINSIVEKLLEFARPSAPIFESVDVIEIVEEVLLLLSTEVAKLNVTAVRNFETPSAPIIGDKAQLKQALLNLCLNGLQAIDVVENRFNGALTVSVGFRKRRHRNIDGAPVDEIAKMFYGTETVATRDDAETVVIKVRDTGLGISRKDLAKIFDPFFTTKEKGVGLGLAVVHGIVKEHSGNISVESKENVGTEFTISLPVTQIFAKERV